MSYMPEETTTFITIKLVPIRLVRALPDADQPQSDVSSVIRPNCPFSATIISGCPNKIFSLINETENGPNKSPIDHFPKSFERKQSNLRNISIEKWFFSRKIVPDFYYNCISFSRSSTSKGISLHTVMNTEPFLKETLLKIKLVKYDSSESSHFGLCDKGEFSSLQDNKMRFNPDQPHCYVTDGYSKFKISDQEFSALSWKNSEGFGFQSGDEIYIHILPEKSITFFLKRHNISIRYKGFHQYCDIRFFMTLVIRSNVFEYQQLI